MKVTLKHEALPQVGQTVKVRNLKIHHPECHYASLSTLHIGNCQVMNKNYASNPQNKIISAFLRLQFKQ